MKKTIKDILIIIAIGLMLFNFIANILGALQRTEIRAKIKQVEKVHAFDWYMKGYLQAEKDFKE